MKADRQKKNWWVDAVLFIGFIAAFYLEWSGIELHQWLGVGVTALAAYHLAAHWDWVKAVTRRFMGGTCSHSRLCYALDAALVVGFAFILLSGLAISTWLELPLADYPAWKNLHVIGSIGTLLVTVAKIALHWRWIVDTAHKRLLKPLATAPAQHTAVRASVRTSNRRDFLKLAGFTGIAAALATGKAIAAITPQTAAAAAPAPVHSEDLSTPAFTPIVEYYAQPEPTQPAANATAQLENEPILTPQATITALPIATATVIAPTSTPAAVAESACRVRCSKGCSYPGRCRKYTDQNNNNLCDLGECI
jgi:hypothetical protein